MPNKYKKEQLIKLFSTCPLKRRDIYMDAKNKSQAIIDSGYNEAVKDFIKWRDELYDQSI